MLDENRGKYAYNVDALSVAQLYDFVKTFDKDFVAADPVSKEVLNEDGTPKVFYHGTNADFSAFDLTKSGSNFGVISEGMFFFTDKKNAYPSSAEDYAKYITKKNGGKERIFECYIKMQNPLVVDSSKSYDPISHYDRNADRIYSRYFSGDYDGIIVKDSTGRNSGSVLALVDNATQIKTAETGDRANIGTFDKSNPDIRRSKKKSYRRAEASATLEEAVAERLVFSDAYAKLKGKSKDEATKMLWEAFNTADGEVAQKAAALRVADYVLDNAVMEAFGEDPNAEYYAEQLSVLKGYLRTLNLDGIKEEIRNRFGKDTSPYLLWGKRQGEPTTTIAHRYVQAPRRNFRISILYLST